ncbi:hypothetical protein [Taibaiella koreensis]|uniref:hypothetical protein n=1 Tax=Taibaiella koreensis TaxID=1268548 RepID=UPI000E59A05B|nr:hypothetical protein [Taibaiella koreensis]
MKNHNLSNDQLYALGFYEGFLLSAFEPETAKQLPDVTEMGSPFLTGVAEGIAQHQHKATIDMLTQTHPKA